MKTFVRSGALVAIIAVVACSSHKPGDQSVTVTSSGSAVTGGSSADPAQLSVPVYPGAKLNKDGTVYYTGADAGVMATFTTTAPFDKVYAFYKAKLPAGSEQMNTQGQDGSIAEFIVLGTGGDISVQINGKGGLTEIIINQKAKN